MGTLNVANLNLTGNTFTTDANLNFGGNWTDAPLGTQVKYGSYYTGTGSCQDNNELSWTVIN